MRLIRSSTDSAPGGGLRTSHPGRSPPSLAISARTLESDDDTIFDWPVTQPLVQGVGRRIGEVGKQDDRCCAASSAALLTAAVTAAP